MILRRIDFLMLRCDVKYKDMYNIYAFLLNKALLWSFTYFHHSYIYLCLYIYTFILTIASLHIHCYRCIVIYSLAFVILIGVFFSVGANNAALLIYHPPWQMPLYTEQEEYPFGAENQL